MNKQAPHIAALKAAFLETYGMKLNARKAGGRLHSCYLLSIPELKAAPEVDRALLVEIGGWLEQRAFFQCHDFHRQGLLSSPAGWTCWEGGAVVLVRHWPQSAAGQR